MKKHSIVALAVSACMLLGLTSCASKSTVKKEVAQGEKKIIYTSSFPLEDFTKRIGGDAFEYRSILPQGMDPHDWEPSPQDIQNLAKGTLLIYNGAGLESWIPAVKEALVDSDLRFVDSSEGVSLIKVDHEHEDCDHEHEDCDHEHEDCDHEHEDCDHEHEDCDHEHEDCDHEHGDCDHEHEDCDHEHEDCDHDHEHGEHKHGGCGHHHGPNDPHIWLDPNTAMKQVENITKALSALEPAQMDTFKANEVKLIDDLKALDHSFQEAFKSAKTRSFLVTHGAFAYLAKAYDLEQMSVSVEEHSDPSPSRMAELVEYAKANNIHDVFYDVIDSPKVAETLAKEIGGKAVAISTLESRSDEQIQNNDSYFDIMKANLEALKQVIR